MSRNRISEILERRGLEIACYDCREPLLIFKPDKVDQILKNGLVVGVFCSLCWSKRKNEDEWDEREEKRKDKS